MKRTATSLVTVALALTLAAACGKKDEEKKKPEPAAKPPATSPDKPAPQADKAEPAAKKDPAVAEPAKPAGKCGATPCPCEEGSFYPEGDKWSVCKLSKSLEVQGQSCAAGRIVFYDSGKLEECMLTTDKEIDGFPCRRAPVAVKWHENGKLRVCNLGTDAKVGDIGVAKYGNIALHDDGTLKNANTKDVMDLDGYKCTGNIRRYKSGKLQGCELVEDAEVHGLKFTKGTWLNLLEDGSLRAIWPPEKGIKLAGKKYKKDKILCFKDNKPDPKGWGCNTFSD